jgi:S1-C subfamily serine protease
MSLEYIPYPEPPAPKKRHRHVIGLSATAAVALAAGAVAGTAAASHSTQPTNATATSTTVLSTSQVAARVDPGLVDVTSTLSYQDAEAKGTGIVLTSAGEVLTNNHVVEGATSVSVTDIGNGKTYKATVVGYDEKQDVAVLRLSGASGLTVASTGDSSTVQVGNKVVALGNAGGKGGTPSVAAGTVTGLNQSITASDESSGTSEQLTGLIESNAGIQPGDSGGPLVNAYGQVIGMDTAASTGYSLGPASGSSESGSSESGTTQGYTIPINTALSIAKQIEGGQASSVVHIGETAFLGIQVSSSSSGYGYGSGSDEPGVTIAGVLSGTPAAEAGLSEGDVITSIAGQSVSSESGIQSVLEQYHPGDKIQISWENESGQSQTATVTLANGPTA